MKKLFFLFLLSILPLIIFSQEIKETKVTTSISSATVYLNNAEITRSKSITIPKGRTLLVFTNLSPVLDEKSIRVTVENEEIDILQISSTQNFMANDQDKPQIKTLNDSLKIIDSKIQNNIDELDAYKIEKDMLLANKSIGGQDNGVSIEELKATAEFYRTRTMEINKKVSELVQKNSKLSKDKIRIQNQLNEMNANSGYNRREVSVLMESEQAVTTEITLKYLVNNAGWSPVYDIKADDTNEPITLIYRAKVFNNTGIDWENIKITLSTSDANLSNSKPLLSTWFLKQSATIYTNMASGEGYIQKKAEIQQNQMDYYNEIPMSGTTSPGYQPTEVFEYEATVPVLSYEFKIEKNYTIPSDDKPYSVNISEKELPATYKHFAVTKLDPGVFLLARIIGWEDLNLIDGPASIFYAGSYIGNSFISTRNVSDTLDISLGRDGKVLVTRHKLNNYSSTLFIGTKKKTTYAYQYEIKNNHKTNVDIEVIDQIPISQSDEIEVKAIELSGGELNITTGEVVWKMNLKPGEVKKLNFTFEVKYPKNIQVPVEQNKSQNIRYFY